MKTAVLVVDMVKDLFNKVNLTKNKLGMINNINALTNYARSKKIPVFFIKQEFKPDLSDAYL